MGRLRTRNVGRSPKGYGRRFSVRVEVTRRGRAFLGCAWVPNRKGSLDWQDQPNFYCVHGRNPRSAVSSALAALAKAVKHRSGAFSGR